MVLCVRVCVCVYVCMYVLISPRLLSSAGRSGQDHHVVLPGGAAGQGAQEGVSGIHRPRTQLEVPHCTPLYSTLLYSLHSLYSLYTRGHAHPCVSVYAW